MTVRSIIKDDRYTFVGEYATDTMTGLYFSKTQDGGNITPSESVLSEHPYSVTVFSTSNPQIIYRASNNPAFPLWHSGTWRSSFPSLSYTGLPALFDSNDQNRLLNKLAYEVKQHSFNAAIATGEGRKSLIMIGDRARQLGNIVKGLRTGNIYLLRKNMTLRSGSAGAVARAAQRPGVNGKNLNSAFLELEYGWRPLVSDLYEASQYAFKLLNRPISRSYRAGIRLPVSGDPGNLLDSAGTHPVIGTYQQKRQIRLVLKEDYNPYSDLGLDDPASLAWELTPYSFVIDWAMPIGNFLSARSFCNNVVVQSCWQSDFRQIRTSRSIYPNHDIVGAPQTSLSITLVRKAISLSAPRPVIKPYSKMTSWKHAIDGLALLYSSAK